MTDLKYKLKHKKGKLSTKVSINGSKSISNRLLVMQALADAPANFSNLSSSDDTRRLVKSLKMINDCESSRIPMVIDAGNAGTVMRFLTAFVAVRPGKWLLTGSERMKQRPIKELLESLINLGADIQCTEKYGYPPLLIRGAALHGKTMVMDASISSQFISALMMIAPQIKNGFTIMFKQKPVSFSYILMTAGLMKAFGVQSEVYDDKVIIPEGDYQPLNLAVEPDWSSASYWYELAAIDGNAEIFLEGFQKESLQGDSVVADIFRSLGVETEYGEKGITLRSKGKVAASMDIDFENCPDLVPAVLSACAALNVRLSLSGVSHLQYKESDRIQVLKTELEKLGATFQINDEKIEMIPGEKPGASHLFFDTYKDHRIAMCLAPLVLKHDELIIDDPMVVEKSYPEFWEHIQQTGLVTVDKI